MAVGEVTREQVPHSRLGAGNAAESHVGMFRRNKQGLGKHRGMHGVPLSPS